jgi:hypothetical protein
MGMLEVEMTVWMNDPASATRDELTDSGTELFLAVTAPVLTPPT